VEGRPIERGIDPPGWVRARRYNEMDPGAVYLDFAQTRAESCLWLQTLSLADLEKSLEHPRFGRLVAGDLVAAWRVHDLLHMRQFSTALCLLTVRHLAPWKSDYAGRIPQPASPARDAG
jgi:hypothetical protein